MKFTRTVDRGNALRSLAMNSEKTFACNFRSGFP